MKRTATVTGLALAAILVGLVATPAQAQGTLVDTRQIPSNGGIIDVALAPGVYELRVSGTYDYDSVREGDQLADAECSTDKVGWNDPIDQVKALIPEAPLSEWHRYRYFVGTTVEPGIGVAIPSYFGLPSNRTNIDALDVAIGARTVLGRIAPIAGIEWVPTPPTPVNDDGEIDAGCNEADHTYIFPIVIVPGVNALLFKIWDPTVADNAGSLTLEVFRLPA